MIDANEEQRFEEAKCELLQLLQIPALEGIPLLVLGNKADLITHKGEAIKELIECLELEVIGQQRLVGCFLVSCKDGLNIGECQSVITVVNLYSFRSSNAMDAEECA